MSKYRRFRVIDVVKEAEKRNAAIEAARRNPDREKLLPLVPAFQQSIYGERYRGHHPAAILGLRSFQMFAQYQLRQTGGGKIGTYRQTEA